MPDSQPPEYMVRGRPKSLPAAGSFPLARGLVLFVVWLALTGADLKDMPVGVLAAALGALASRALVPQPLGTPRWGALLAYCGIFIRQSVLAGIDIARRAFDPALPLKTGLVAFAPTLPAGPARTLFADIASMAPGTLPVGEAEDGTMDIHCLDTDADAAAQLAADEARLKAAIGIAPDEERFAGP